MARYIISNRRSGKFSQRDKLASREALSATLESFSGVDILRENAPSSNDARHSVMVNMDPEEVAAMKGSLPADVIVEREIIHHVATGIPREFLESRSTWYNAPTPVGSATLNVTVTGTGTALPGAEVALYLRGPGGIQRQLIQITSSTGTAQFSFSRSFNAAALVVNPAASFWPMLLRGPQAEAVIDCPALPAAGSVGSFGSTPSWWHGVVGSSANEHLGQGIRVGVIDTGSGPHALLGHVTNVGSLIEGRFDADGGADSDRHGTHVVGTIGARAVSEGQYAGIAPGAELYSARVFPPGQGANQMDISDAIDLLSGTYGVDLINLSLGAEQGSEIERDAIIDALERGTLCVCAAGNSAGAVQFPAAFAETVAVSALGWQGWAPPGSLSANNLPQAAELFGDDNLYLANFSCFGSQISVTAPGVGIISAVPALKGDDSPFAALDGTSMASPVACGALASLLSDSAAYQRLPRDITRAEMARKLLRDNTRRIGLEPIYEGQGIPVIPTTPA